MNLLTSAKVVDFRLIKMDAPQRQMQQKYQTLFMNSEI